jgi:DNA-binding XRE family transcriptional regulator
MSQFSINLRKLRKEYKVRQKDVAEKLNIKTFTYQAYEEDRASPPSLILIKLAEMYSITVNDLVRADLSMSIAPIKENLLLTKYNLCPDFIKVAIDCLLKISA